MQNAPDCQDLVTTQQDNGKTCRDVFAKVKPSVRVPQAVCRFPTGRCGAPALTRDNGGTRWVPTTARPCRDVLVLPVSIGRRIRVPHYSSYRSDAERLVSTPSCPE